MYTFIYRTLRRHGYADVTIIIGIHPRTKNPTNFPLYTFPHPIAFSPGAAVATVARILWVGLSCQSIRVASLCSLFSSGSYPLTHITLMRISSIFWQENKARAYGHVWVCLAEGSHFRVAQLICRLCKAAMHAWTMVTDTPISQGLAQAKTGKDHRQGGDGFPGSRHRLRATTTVRLLGRRTSWMVYGPVPKVVVVVVRTACTRHHNYKVTSALPSRLSLNKQKCLQ